MSLNPIENWGIVKGQIRVTRRCPSHEVEEEIQRVWDSIPQQQDATVWGRGLSAYKKSFIFRFQVSGRLILPPPRLAERWSPQTAGALGARLLRRRAVLPLRDALLPTALHAAEHMIACRGSSAEATSVSGDGDAHRATYLLGVWGRYDHGPPPTPRRKLLQQTVPLRGSRGLP